MRLVAVILLLGFACSGGIAIWVKMTRKTDRNGFAIYSQRAALGDLMRVDGACKDYPGLTMFLRQNQGSKVQFRRFQQWFPKIAEIRDIPEHKVYVKIKVVREDDVDFFCEIEIGDEVGGYTSASAIILQKVPLELRVKRGEEGRIVTNNFWRFWVCVGIFH